MKNIGFEVLKNISILLIILSLLFCAFNNSFVYADNDFNPDDYKPDPVKVDIKGETKLQQVGLSVVGPIRIVGSFMSVFALILIGIKYMIGSVEEKAEYKKTLLPYFIGCIMVFGIINIVSMIYDMASGI